MTRTLVADEQRRRSLLPPALGVTAVLALLAFLVPGSSRRPRAIVASSGEEKRLVAALGDPNAALVGARQKAAALLGVPVDAPAEAVEAALQREAPVARCRPARGSGPGLQRAAREQREALSKARDLLLKKPGAAQAR